MLGEISRWQAALAGLGLQRGDRVAIMLRNCPQWLMFDQAALSLGLVVVPLYTVDRPDNVAYIVNDADVKVLLFENAEQWQNLRTVRDQLGVWCDLSASTRLGMSKRAAPETGGGIPASVSAIVGTQPCPQTNWPASCIPRAPPADRKA